MNRTRTIAIAAATALVSLGAAVPAFAAPTSPTGTTTIMFDGFCDGFTMNLPSAGVGTAGTLDGTQAGCESNPIFGTAGKPYDVSSGTEYVTLQTYGIFTVIRANQTWTHYVLSGSLITELISGTWSFAAPGAPRATGPSSVAAAVAAKSSTHTAAPARMTKTKQISFDGHCDGMSLTSPSAGLGTKGTVDGTWTGCSSYALMGAKGKVGPKKKSYATTADLGSGTYVHAAVLKDHTWVLYETNGSAEVVLNSGTWSNGPPAQGKGLRSAIAG